MNKKLTPMKVCESLNLLLPENIGICAAEASTLPENIRS